MARIYCIVGKSCSGKDTIFQQVLLNKKDIIPIITYTTRPKRSYEKNAKEYYFVDKHSYNKLVKANKIIESRKYKTQHGEWIYFIVNDGQIDINSDKKYIVINSLTGARKLKDIYGDNNVVVINIYVNDTTRIMRAVGREINGDNDFVQMCQRFINDTKDYSDSNFEELNLREISIENEDVSQCVEEVCKIIK